MKYIEAIGKIAKKYKVFFHTDTVQAIGNCKIDVNKMGIDSLSMSGHKFYGPKGIGVLYVKNGVPFLRQNDGGHQEHDKRSGTENTAGIVGLGKAIELANNNLEKYNNQLTILSGYYIREVQKRVPHAKINGDENHKLAGNNNICFPGVDGGKLVQMLNEKGICASSGSACSAGLINPSHVLLATGLSPNLAKSSLRITFGKENTIDDVKYLVDTLEKLLIK